jgi:hypothetical protein
MRRLPRTASKPAHKLRRSVPPAAQAHGRALHVVIVLIALAAAGAWWYLAPQSLPGFVRTHLPASPRANPPLYKWRDAQGRVHVTDTPPTDRPYQTLRFDPNANVLPQGVAPSK